MNRFITIYAIIFCISFSLCLEPVCLVAELSTKKLNNNIGYGLLSYKLKFDNGRNTTLITNQPGSQQLNPEKNTENLNLIKNHIVSINEIPNLIIGEDNLQSKNISIIDNPDFRRILVDTNTVIKQIKYSGLENKLVKVTFELKNPIMNLVEDYYILDNTDIYYKSSNYYGTITIEQNTMNIDIYYPEYKKNIAKPLFLNELYQLIK